MAYQICTSCVMDTTDPKIIFDDNGICNHCHSFIDTAQKEWFPNQEGAEKLNLMIQQIQSTKKKQGYNCILGLSGGIDSSYLALQAKKWGLNPLVIHVDAGWNSELAVANIEKIVNYCGFDLHTLVIDWKEMRDLHLSYLKSGIANQDVPQDHAFFAGLYHFATKNDIRYILNGGNLATEGVFPASWHGSAMDAINLRSIHRQYGTIPLKAYKTISFFDYYLWYPFFKKMRTLRPLNYLPYNKQEAIAELEQMVGWTAYGRKHGESLFTRFFQNYYLPTKFGFDKRRPHLSSLIVSGQLTRNNALLELEQPLYDPRELEMDIAFFCKKLRLTRTQFDEYLRAPSKDYSDFPNWNFRYGILKSTQNTIQGILGKKIKIYS